MPKSILVIDDEPLVTRSLEKLLKANGYSAAVALTAQEALEKIKNTNFDLIISDVRMPGTNGIEAISQIREYLNQNNKGPIPEIFITGYADDNNYAQALRLGVVDYIYKPFDTEEMLTSVKKALAIETTKSPRRK